MYINSEKDLEDYICENIEGFIKFLNSIYGKDENIEFVGRQVIIGDSRIDLLFKVDNEIEGPYGLEKSRTFIVVELKFRDTEPKDVAQLTRYMNLLYDLDCDERIGNVQIFVKGLLLSTGLNNDMQEIEMYLDNYSNTDISFAQINTFVHYSPVSYSRKEEYIKNMTIDSRLRKSKEEQNNGEKEDDIS